MNSGVLSVPLVPDFVGSVQDRLLHDFATVVRNWSESVSALTRWEDDHLLDNPTPELLAQHKAALEKLFWFGKFISISTELPEFPDKELSKIVSATQSCFRDKLAMWHGPKMSLTESEKILSACFPE